MTSHRGAVPVARAALRAAFFLTIGAAFCVAQTALQPSVEPGQEMTDASPQLQQGVPEDILEAMAARQAAQPMPFFATPSDALSGGPKAPGLNPKSQYNAHFGTVDFGAGGGVFIYTNVAPAGHPSVVTSASVAFDKYIAAYGEFAYTHIAGEAGSGLGINLFGTGYLLDYGGGAHVTIPTRSRIVPYGTLGFGRSDLRGSASVAGLGSFSGRLVAWNFNLGGGVKFFITPKVALDFDFRAYRPTLDGYSLWYGRASLGVLFRFNNKKS